MDSPYLTVLELADILRVPLSRVYEWTRERGVEAIPSYRAGKRLVFDREEVMAWFKRTQRRDSAALIRGQHRRTLLRTRGSGASHRVIALRQGST
jgi:excisionase family DNA binding protein